MSAKKLNELNTGSIRTALFTYWSPTAGFSNNNNNNSFNCNRRAHSTIDSKDFYQVNTKISKAFWDSRGTFEALYRLNCIRVPYIRDSLVDVAPGEKFSNCLKGKKILDIGCGGGFLSEALAMLGAEVTGIDPSEGAIEHAKQHSSQNKRLVNNLPAYSWTTIEQHSKEYAETYDVVIASEVIDHVDEQELFVESCARAGKPGAKIFFTTINRTRLAQFFIIFVYESVLKIIPKGVHEFDKFIKPSELKYMLEMTSYRYERGGFVLFEDQLSPRPEAQSPSLLAQPLDLPSSYAQGLVTPEMIRPYPKVARDVTKKFKKDDCFVESTKGYVYYPMAKYWDWTKHTMCFFAIEAVKSK